MHFEKSTSFGCFYLFLVSLSFLSIDWIILTSSGWDPFGPFYTSTYRWRNRNSCFLLKTPPFYLTREKCFRYDKCVPFQEMWLILGYPVLISRIQVTFRDDPLVHGHSSAPRTVGVWTGSCLVCRFWNWPVIRKIHTLPLKIAEKI